MKCNLFSIAAFILPLRSHSYWRWKISEILLIKSILVFSLKTLTLVVALISQACSFPHSLKGKVSIFMALGKGQFYSLCDAHRVPCSALGMLGDWALCPGLHWNETAPIWSFNVILAADLGFLDFNIVSTCEILLACDLLVRTRPF